MRRRSPLGGGLGGSRGLRRTMRQVRRRRVRMRRRRMLLTGGMVAIAVAGTATAIKLSQKDAQRIEQHTGQKPEDLSEAQLDQAIADLNIETDELTDAEVSAIEAADAEPAAPPASTPPAAPAAPASQPDYITELERLAELRDKGIITAEEFEAKKKQLLGL
ncbi:MAG: SHOCT domain-containing protein [Anaerolineae bacterium]|nr:SHOCT domain-containing protein [Anaerolineae bacterium]